MPLSLTHPWDDFFFPWLSTKDHIGPLNFECFLLYAILFKRKGVHWHSDITTQSHTHFLWVHHDEMGPLSECGKHQVRNWDWAPELAEGKRGNECHLVKALWLSFLRSATPGTSAVRVCTRVLQFTHSKFQEPLKNINILHTFFSLQTEVTINPSPSNPREAACQPRAKV